MDRHEGPVWQLSWSHPTFGSLLASCSYDRKVLIWKETTSTGLPPQANVGGGTQYSIIYEHDRHTSSGKYPFHLSSVFDRIDFSQYGSMGTL